MAGKEYQMAFAIGAKLQSQFGSVFKSASANVITLQNSIEGLNKQQGNIAAYQKAQAAIEKTKSRLQVLREQYANLKTAMAESGDASAEMKNKLLAKGLAIDNTGKKLGEQQARLNQYGNALTKAGIDTQNLGAASESLSSQIEALKAEQEGIVDSSNEMADSLGSAVEGVAELAAAAGLMAAFKEATDVMKQCAEEAIAFETAMASVKRTVGGSEVYLKELGDSFKQMSTEIPVTTGELAEIASTAGQLGIAQKDVKQFSETMAKLATTTDLSANEAASMIAQFSNITGITQYDRLGSVIAELGDATATTASKVVEMSQGMAAAANMAGMSGTDIMAISAAVGSLGIEAQAGSTSMSTLISTLHKAVETGNNLSEYASVANMSAEQFQQAWGVNAVGAMNAFIQGLNDTERNGKSAIVILDELGITNARQTKAILGLASAGDLLSRTITQAGNAWAENTALTQKASVMYGTTSAKLTMLNNAFSNLQIAVGDAFTPVIGGAADAMTDMLRPVTEFVANNPALVRAFTAAAGVIGAVTIAMTGYAAATKLAAKVTKEFALILPGAKTIMGVTLAVSGLVAGITLLSSAFGEQQRSMEELSAEFGELNDQYQEQQHIVDLCKRYRQLRTELDGISESGDGEILLRAEIIKKGFSTDEDLKVITDLSKLIEDKKGEIAQTLAVYGAEDISDEDMARLVELAANVQTADGELLQQLSIIGSDDISDADLALIRDLSSAIVTAEGTLKQAAIIDLSNVSSVSIQRISDLHNAIATAQGKLKQALEIEGAQNVTDDALGKITSLGSVIKTDSGILRETLSILGADQATEENIGKISQLAALIQSNEGTLKETLSIVGTGEASPENLERINSLKDAIATNTGTLKETLSVIGITDASPENIARITELATAIQTNSGTLKETLSVIGLEDASPENVNRITSLAAAIQTAEGKLSETLALTGFENYDNFVAACQLSDMVKDVDGTIKVTVTEEGLARTKEELQALQSEAKKTKEELSTASTNLGAMRERLESLKARAKYASSESGLQQIQGEIESLTGAIGEQETKVSELETAYTLANAQYQIAASATEALEAKKAELAEIEAQLVAASDGTIAAISGETAEYQRQLEALEAIASAKQADMRSQIYSNAQQQAKAYAKASKEAAEYMEQMAPFLNQAKTSEQWLGQSAEEVNATYQGILATLNQMQAMEGFDPLGADFQAKINEAQVMAKLMGTYFSDLAQYADQDIDWQKTFGWVTTNSSTWTGELEHMNRMIAQYGEEISDAQAIQQAFIDNLAGGIKSGAITIEEAEGLIKNSFANTEEGAAMAAQAIDQVKEAIAGASEEAATAAQETANVQAEIGPFIAEMEKLGKAYQEAYDSAYQSMSGQFKLFEQMDQITGKTGSDGEAAIQSMLAALQSQAEYMATYQANLKAVKEMELADGLISQLSDGSKESAQILADIVASGAESIDELNIAFNNVQDGKAAFADTVAEMETDFAAQMNAIQSDLNALIAEMDMSADAAQAGADTVQAFADGASGKLSVVTAAFQAVAKAAAAAVSLRFPGHAAGTDNAEPGFAMVGERGPELVYFRGGEQVLNAQETQSVMRGTEAISAVPMGDSSDRATLVNHLEVKPTIMIEGGGAGRLEDEATVQRLTEEIKAEVLDALEEAESDRRRRAYTYAR